jgi:hypothetical protein
MFLNESMAENSRREDRVQDDDPLNHIRRGFVFLIKTNIAKQPDTCFSLCYWYRPNDHRRQIIWEEEVGGATNRFKETKSSEKNEVPNKSFKLGASTCGYKSNRVSTSLSMRSGTLQQPPRKGKSNRHN